MLKLRDHRLFMERPFDEIKPEILEITRRVISLEKTCQEPLRPNKKGFELQELEAFAIKLSDLTSNGSKSSNSNCSSRSCSCSTDNNSCRCCSSNSCNNRDSSRSYSRGCNCNSTKHLAM